MRFKGVPGITSAIAVPAYAGIPVSHRGLANSVTIATGHRAAQAETAEPELTSDGDTLVFLMGVGNLRIICEQLVAQGRSPETPAAVVARGTGPEQHTVTGTLGTVSTLAAGVLPPAVLVVGEVVRLRSVLQWYEGRRLSSSRVLVGADADGFVLLRAGLAALGAEVVELPLAGVPPVDDVPGSAEALAGLVGGQYDWLLFPAAGDPWISFSPNWRLPVTTQEGLPAVKSGRWTL